MAEVAEQEQAKDGRKEPRGEVPFDLGVFGRPVRQGIGAAEIVAALLSVLWLGAVAGFFMWTEADPAGGEPVTLLFTALAILLPLAMIWVAAIVAKTARVTREEARRVQAALDAMRKAQIVQQQTAGLAIRPSVERKLNEIAETARKTEAALATFSSRRAGEGAARDPNKTIRPAPATAAAGAQPSLELETPAEALADPITVAEFIRALNFPEDENDIEGFRILKRALDDPTTSKLIRAAEDILTLLSQDGIYMDDLNPPSAGAEVWRKFAKGERGRAVAALGAVRDRSCLALTHGRMKTDPVFRDAAHHFLRQFDKVFTDFAAHASDEEILEVEATRTARAFMLLGRVAGTFD